MLRLPQQSVTPSGFFTNPPPPTPAADPALAAQFDTEDLFVALRMHPYFETLAQRHPELSSTIAQIVTTTLTTRLALVHGDVSPKNILTGADGPILLDAECAWWGDPAFDLAFCLNHLLLKFLVLPQHHEELSTAFGALLVAYQQHTAWESPAALLDRTATLLPALLLARVDGRSPVEYLDVTQRATVRDFALPRVAASLTVHRETDPMDILAAWKDHLSWPTPLPRCAVAASGTLEVAPPSRSRCSPRAGCARARLHRPGHPVDQPRRVTCATAVRGSAGSTCSRQFPACTPSLPRHSWGMMSVRRARSIACLISSTPPPPHRYSPRTPPDPRGARRERDGCDIPCRAAHGVRRGQATVVAISQS